MTDNEIVSLIAKCGRLDTLASDHQRAAGECKSLQGAWKKDCPEASRLYRNLFLEHSNQRLELIPATKRLRAELETLLAKTIPAGAERPFTYLSALEDGTCLTYDQYIGIVEEQEAEAQEMSKPMDISEDPSPF